MVGAAIELVQATTLFLNANKFSSHFVLERANSKPQMQRYRRSYQKFVAAYQDMGIVMATWFTNAKFQDAKACPLPLDQTGRLRSIASLIKASGVRTSARIVLELLRRSPSVSIDSAGKYVARKRVFVLPEFEVARAALVVSRYLETLRRNSNASSANDAISILERNCFVPIVEAKKVAPILRDIKERGVAFMDSIDGDIEAQRVRRGRRKDVAELGVLTFAWTRHAKPRSRTRK